MRPGLWRHHRESHNNVPHRRRRTLVAFGHADGAEHGGYFRFLLGRPGLRRQASTWNQLSGVSRGIITVIVSVSPRSAHQAPPLVLVSTAGRPPMVVFGFGGWTVGGPPDQDSPRRQPARQVVAGLRSLRRGWS